MYFCLPPNYRADSFRTVSAYLSPPFSRVFFSRNLPNLSSSGATCDLLPASDSVNSLLLMDAVSKLFECFGHTPLGFRNGGKQNAARFSYVLVGPPAVLQTTSVPSPRFCPEPLFSILSSCLMVWFLSNSCFPIFFLLHV